MTLCASYELRKYTPQSFLAIIASRVYASSLLALGPECSIVISSICSPALDQVETDDSHSLVSFLPNMSVAALKPASTLEALSAPPLGYVQSPFLSLAFRIFNDSRRCGRVKAYDCNIFLILVSIFTAVFSAACLRTGRRRRKSSTRTVVPTG